MVSSSLVINSCVIRTLLIFINKREQELRIGQPFSTCFQVLDCRPSLPVARQLLKTAKEMIEVCTCSFFYSSLPKLTRHRGVNPLIQVMWPPPEVLKRFPFWAAEHVTLVNKDPQERPVFLLEKDGLAIIPMVSTAIEQICEPELFCIRDPS
jgi:hypothetical protein